MSLTVEQQANGVTYIGADVTVEENVRMAVDAATRNGPLGALLNRGG
ncbi:hypothetical protein J2X46_004063 [Nocardioides sp. BE266]|nr:hypothetical protein [Nocardioides sp. BE266]MDR7255061.1 hypothetical protein [Nocardioides sp. BE266]